MKKAVWPAVQKGPGNHRMPIIEVEYNDFMGEKVHKVVRPLARHLICHNKKVLRCYNATLEKFFSKHKFVPKLHKVYATSMTVLS